MTNWFDSLADARADAEERGTVLLTYLHAPG